MKKGMIFIGVLGLILISGCNQKDTTPKKLDAYREETIYGTCFLNIYEIEFVDELIPTNCYAFKRSSQWDDYIKQRLNDSFQYTGRNTYSIWKEQNPNKDCMTLTTLSGYHRESPAFCLSNKSKCMIIEDNKICHIISLS